LLSIPDIYRTRAVNEEAVFHWITAGLKDLDTATFFDGIHSLPAGSWTWVEQDFPTQATKFWEVPRQRMREQDISTVEAARQLRSTVEDAVRIRLRADVPLSAELSGGMDSSSVVALAAQAYPEKLTTYTVRFPGEGVNEEPYARMVARKYNVDYRVLESPTENFWSQIRSFTHLEEEPYHSPNLQTAQVIWTRMRAAGTKIALSGAAGDIDFAGYGRYFSLAQRDNLMRGRLDRFLANALLDSAATSRLQMLLEPLWSLSRGLARHLVPERVVRHMRQRHRQTSPYQGKGYRACSFSRLTLSEFLRAEMTSTLNPYYMRSGDRGYMGVPLETRDPLLDFRVIDLAFQLPVTYLIRNGWHKWILRKAMEDLLPAEIVWRKKKMGFPFPYADFRENNREIFDKIFTTASNPFLDLSRRQALEGNWKLMSFLLWYEYYFNENFDLFASIEQLARQKHKETDYGFRPEFLRSCRIQSSPRPAG
jgi:asparagine synthase (glutamine-hydrolysing)